MSCTIEAVTGLLSDEHTFEWPLKNSLLSLILVPTARSFKLSRAGASFNIAHFASVCPVQGGNFRYIWVVSSFVFFFFMSTIGGPPSVYRV